MRVSISLEIGRRVGMPPFRCCGRGLPRPRLARSDAANYRPNTFVVNYLSYTSVFGLTPPSYNRKSMTDLAYQRVVVKLGTSTLTGGTSRLAPARIVELVRQMTQLMEAGCEVLLGSSGAIAAGRERLGAQALPSAILPRQLLSAVGQPRALAP